MKKTSVIIKLSFKFFSKYASDYIKYMLKYILIGAFGLIFLPLCSVNPIFAIGAIFITIPAFCYSFWKGYLATYALNFGAFEFLAKKSSSKFEDFVNLAKQQENGLIKYVVFIAVISLIGYIPTIVYLINSIPFEKIMLDPLNTSIDMKNLIIVSIINTVVLAQFMNFSLQAFFFRKKENYFGLLINCYKTGFGGFVISNLIIAVTSILSVKAIVLYILLFLPLNLIIYSVNLFWYFAVIEKNKLKSKTL